MRKKSVVILVLCSSNQNFKKLEHAIKETWFNYGNDEVEILFYADNDAFEIKSQHPVFDGCNLILPCHDGYHNCGVKTLLALDWVRQNYEYRYIYRSNLGAYVNPDKLLTFLTDKPARRFYCGIVGEDSAHFGRPVKFASGSGYFLSRDVVDIVAENYRMWDHSAIDDVALGDLLSKFDIAIDKSARRLNLCNDRRFYQIGDRTVDSIPKNEIYHVRLRSDNREQDIERMRQLYEERF
jgi:hypothetical protein